MGNKVPPAPFLSKTFQIVDDPATNNVISWSETGDTFIVWSLSLFSEHFLPIYFKHNNFSSFVRQLNTYGFRKIGLDKWEFANDNFRRGQMELLAQIRRRKTLPHKCGEGGNSPSNSGDDIGSTSSSNLGSVDTGTMFADLTEEIEKLKKENQMLSSELAEKKKQCEEYADFLIAHFKVTRDEMTNIVKKGNNGEAVKCDGKKEAGEEEEDGEDNNVGTLKLFGVWLKEKKVKRGRDEKLEGSACNPPPHAKAVKAVEVNAPGMAK